MGLIAWIKQDLKIEPRAPRKDAGGDNAPEGDRPGLLVGVRGRLRDEIERQLIDEETVEAVFLGDLTNTQVLVCTDRRVLIAKKQPLGGLQVHVASYRYDHITSVQTTRRAPLGGHPSTLEITAAGVPLVARPKISGKAFHAYVALPHVFVGPTVMRGAKRSDAVVRAAAMAIQKRVVACQSATTRSLHPPPADHSGEVDVDAPT